MTAAAARSFPASAAAASEVGSSFVPSDAYGHLSLPPGQSAALETLVIGSLRHARLGEEQFANATAKQYRIKLRPQIAGYCTWYSDKHRGAGDEKGIAELAAYVAKELKPFGFSFLQIDDEWQDGGTYNGPRRGFDRVRPTGPYPHRHATRRRQAFAVRPHHGPVVYALRPQSPGPGIQGSAILVCETGRWKALRDQLGRNVARSHTARGQGALGGARQANFIRGASSTSKWTAFGPEWPRNKSTSTTGMSTTTSATTSRCTIRRRRASKLFAMGSSSCARPPVPTCSSPAATYLRICIAWGLRSGWSTRCASGPITVRNGPISARRSRPTSAARSSRAPSAAAGSIFSTAAYGGTIPIRAMSANGFR